MRTEGQDQLRAGGSSWPISDGSIYEYERLYSGVLSALSLANRIRRWTWLS